MNTTNGVSAGPAQHQHEIVAAGLITREHGYLYFVRGTEVWRRKIAGPRAEQPPAELVTEIPSPRERGYLYNIDAAGNVRRTPMARGMGRPGPRPAAPGSRRDRRERRQRAAKAAPPKAPVKAPPRARQRTEPAPVADDALTLAGEALRAAGEALRAVALLLGAPARKGRR